MYENVRFYDVTMRDGNHALRHRLSAEFLSGYALASVDAPTWALEVGHGNGLGGSSFLVGISAESDQTLLECAKSFLGYTKLSVHSIPGFSTIQRDIAPALEIGVDLVRVASHVTEASVCEKHVEYVASKEATVHGVLMMSHMATTSVLVDNARQLLEYGATGIIVMDSAGHYRPAQVFERINALVTTLGCEVGFHAHNNLGMAVSNAIAAIRAGATIIDVSSAGLGAGAGNASYEFLALALEMDFLEPKSFEAVLRLSEMVFDSFRDKLPGYSPSTLRGGILGVFSGYTPQVESLSIELGVDKQALWNAIAGRKLVAGQESMLREIAQDLSNL